MIQPTLRVMIASPLEPEHVATIQCALPSHVELLHEPALLPPTRYTGDHVGPPGFRRTPEQEQRWQEVSASADIAFDFPYTDRPPHTCAPNLKWVQTTSAGVGQLATRLGIAPGQMIITTASGVHARPLAEFVFMVLLMAVKDHQRLVTGQHAHQ
jgi:phosphoglycerate dehydrogenase-like enzyme